MNISKKSIYEKRAYTITARTTYDQKKAIEKLAVRSGMSEGDYLLSGRMKEVAKQIQDKKRVIISS